jgi:hypothetical protein
LTELVPLKAFSEETFTLLALDAVQPVGRVVPASKFAQMVSPPLHPPPEELELLDELLELEEELEELLLVELLLLDELLEVEELLELDELLELEELDDEPELVPPQAARAQDARITGINFRMVLCLIILSLSILTYYALVSSLPNQQAVATCQAKSKRGYSNGLLGAQAPAKCDLARDSGG